MIQFRTPAPTDVETLSRLMEQHSITMAGLSGKSFLHAVVADATTGERVNIVLADSDGRIVGWSIALINPRSYWKSFLFFHPILGARVICRRVRFRLAAYREIPGAANLDSDPFGETQWLQRSTVMWGSSCDSVAKHIDITVCSPLRNSGIGCQLQQAHLESLRACGVKRVDAVISKGNVPSVKFHIKLGWSLVRTDEQTLYITKDIE